MSFISGKNREVMNTTNRFAQMQRYLLTERAVFHPPILLVRMLMSLLPMYVGGEFRTKLLRLIGFRLGKGTTFWGSPIITGDGDLYSRLQTGEECWINIDCIFDLSAPITLGNRVAVGHRAMFITGSHEMGDMSRRAGNFSKAPITIGDGVWIGSGSIILPGVTVQAGAVVAAGAVVTQNVPSNVLVGGTPAQVIRPLPTPS